MSDLDRLIGERLARTVPPMTFVVPEGIHALPVDASAEERAAAAAGFVRDLYPGGDSTLWESAAPYYEQVTAAMATAGLAFSALGIFGLDGPGVAHCSLTAAFLETDHRDPDVAAQGILATLASDPLNDARWLDLPCGPAVSCVTLRQLALDLEPTSASADDEQPKLITGQIQVHIPFPTGPYMAVFTLDTASMEYWGEFCDMIMAILQTVSFSDPESESEPDSAEDGSAGESSPHVRETPVVAPAGTVR
ncbi:hypothetical protein ACFQ7F_23920 [Streptomyces sp. NPDC056486]|uniref:hypothetical protein n=1 Tax=Streptomyces sp. NPDC056486 TaxID=3345835 RepID=UPI0036BB0A1A